MSSTYQPWATAGSARRASAGLYQLPLGHYHDSVAHFNKQIFFPAETMSSAKSCHREGWRGAGCPRGNAQLPGGGWLPLPGCYRDLQEAIVSLVPEAPQHLGDDGAAGGQGKQTCVCREECLLRAGPAPALFLIPRGPEGGLFIRDRLYQIDLASLKKKIKLIFGRFLGVFFGKEVITREVRGEGG